MSQPNPSSPATATNEFDAAKAIVDALKGLDKQLQARALRFASESLGLEAASAPTLPAAQDVPARQPHLIPNAAAHESTSRPKDIKQFTSEKSPKNDQQFAAVVAYYYRFEAPEADRKEIITPTDLTEAARLVARTRPPNPRMTLTNAKNAGYLDSAGVGAYKINTVGENLVAVTLPGSGPEGDSKQRTAKKKVPKRRPLNQKKTTPPPKRKSGRNG